MATWTNVSSTVLEPGDPIRSVDIIAIKENIIALSEGASGAPKILTNAINDNAVTAAKIASGVILSETAAASAGAVGTYAFLGLGTLNVSIAFGSTRAGSNLYAAGIRSGGSQAFNQASPGTSTIHGGSTAARAGTWRCMGTAAGSSTTAGATVWLRIS